MKYYEVKFNTKKGYPKNWIVNIEANNKKDAIYYAKMMWEEDNRLSDMHMFHITARKLKETEEFKYQYFAICGD